MLRNILTYGVIAGLIVGIPLFTMGVTLDHGHVGGAWGMVIGYTIMLVALTTVFVAVKRRRDTELGGVIRFWPAFGYGLAISTVAGLIYVLAWEAAMLFMDSSFAATYAQATLDAARAEGASAAEMATLQAQMNDFVTMYANPAMRVAMTFFMEFFPVGLLVSLISAALLRNSRFMPAQVVA